MRLLQRALRCQVAAVRELAGARGVACNAQIPDAGLDDALAATPAARSLLGRWVERLGLSARGARRAMRVARTCADLAGERRVDTAVMAEALAYRGAASTDAVG